MTRCPRRSQTSTHSDWLSSRCASRTAVTGRFYLYFLQVLTGDAPFLGVPTSALVYRVVSGGVRPAKPWNAPALGFSDSLWAFTQRCWSGDVESRPGAEEVVTCLGEAVASWDGLMPPCAPAKIVTSDSRGAWHSTVYLDSSEESEFDIAVPP